MGDLLCESATSLVKRLGSGEVSSRELLDLFLARIDERNAAVNAVVTLDVERARSRADEADRARSRGESWGPLHGLPVSIKDTLETAGLRTTAGVPELAGHVPERDAAVVERLVRAGAIVFAKTNTPPYAGDLQTTNEIFGTTRNPWNPERTSGGSSGGSAVAAALGFSAFEIGSDIGGSIRTPSHWCGVYGHKPTHGIVPDRGHIPGPPGTLAETDLAVVGPIARSAADLGLVLDLVAGPLPERSRAWRFSLPPARHDHLRDFRVAAWLDDEIFPVDPSVRGILETTVEALRGAGVSVDTEARPDVGFREVLDVYGRLLWPVLLAGVPERVIEGLAQSALSADPVARDATAWQTRCAMLRHREWLVAHEHRERLRAKMTAFFDRFDVFLLPVTQVPAIPHDHSQPLAARTITIGGETRSYLDLLAWISLATTTLLPATVAPAGRTAEGLPVGIQIVGPYLEDRTTIRFADLLGEVSGGYEPPSP